jgi:hypothetical protein
MAIKYSSDNNYLDISSIVYIKNKETIPVISLYYYTNNNMYLLFNSDTKKSNFITKDNKIIITVDNFIFNSKT